MPDHTHLLIGLKPSQSISDLARDIKAGSSGFINEKNGSLGSLIGRKDSVLFHMRKVKSTLSSDTSRIRKSIIRGKHLKKSILNIWKNLKLSTMKIICLSGSIRSLLRSLNPPLFFCLRQSAPTEQNNNGKILRQVNKTPTNTVYSSAQNSMLLRNRVTTSLFHEVDKTPTNAVLVYTYKKVRSYGTDLIFRSS